MILRRGRRCRGRWRLIREVSDVAESFWFDVIAMVLTELRGETGEYRLRDRPWRLPHSYTLVAIKE